jgi:hypothetical protein
MLAFGSFIWNLSFLTAYCTVHLRMLLYIDFCKSTDFKSSPWQRTHWIWWTGWSHHNTGWAHTVCGSRGLGRKPDNTLSILGSFAPKLGCGNFCQYNYFGTFPFALPLKKDMIKLHSCLHKVSGKGVSNVILIYCTWSSEKSLNPHCPWLVICWACFQTCSKALHCLSVGGVGSSLLAGGGADPVLRIWDPRIPGKWFRLPSRIVCNCGKCCCICWEGFPQGCSKLSFVWVLQFTICCG